MCHCDKQTVVVSTTDDDNDNNDTYTAQIRKCSKCANAYQRQIEMF